MSNNVLKGFRIGEKAAQQRIARLVLIDDPNEQRRQIAELSRQRNEDAAAAVETWLQRVHERRLRLQARLIEADGEAAVERGAATGRGGAGGAKGRGPRTARSSAGPRRG